MKAWCLTVAKAQSIRRRFGFFAAEFDGKLNCKEKSYNSSHRSCTCCRSTACNSSFKLFSQITQMRCKTVNVIIVDLIHGVNNRVNAEFTLLLYLLWHAHCSPALKSKLHAPHRMFIATFFVLWHMSSTALLPFVEIASMGLVETMMQYLGCMIIASSINVPRFVYLCARLW